MVKFVNYLGQDNFARINLGVLTFVLGMREYWLGYLIYIAYINIYANFGAVAVQPFALKSLGTFSAFARTGQQQKLKLLTTDSRAGRSPRAGS